MTIDILLEEGDVLSARELSERIAERETNQNPPPRNIRQSAYVSLLQTHLPKLHELGVIEYDDGQKTVRLSSGAEQISEYMETGYRTSVDTFYLVTALVGLVVVLSPQVTASLLDPPTASLLAGVLFTVVGGVAARRLYRVNRPE